MSLHSNQFNDQLPLGLLPQLVRALQQYRKGIAKGSNPIKPVFFQTLTTIIFFSFLSPFRDSIYKSQIFIIS